MYSYVHFQSLDPFGAESVSGSAFGKGPVGVFQDLGTYLDSI